MDKKGAQHFNVLAVPYRRAFIVAANKRKGFLSQKIDSKIDEKIASAASKLNNDDLTKEAQHFDVLAVPCSRAFVVARDKKEDFLAQKADPKVIAEIEATASKLNINNLTEKGPVLVKKRRVFNKT